jgi:hypothetical protein
MEFLSITKRYNTTKGNLKHELDKKIRMQLVVDVDYSSIAKFQTKIPATFQGIFGIFVILRNFSRDP